MRMSCNGCRVLRKGCCEDCSLRPCLQWIKSPDSQANATVFLAKFYGRAGLINLLNAGPPHLRPAIFKSLLHEACGRIISPIKGSVGLMCSGNWKRCQEAVKAVLEGSPITQFPVDDESPDGEPEQIIKPLKRCDIRHLSKSSPNVVHKVRTRNRLKRSALSAANNMVDQVLAPEPVKFSITGWELEPKDELNRASSHGSFDSGETVEPSLVNPEETGRVDQEMDLELSLGFNVYSQISAPADSSDRDV